MELIEPSRRCAQVGTMTMTMRGCIKIVMKGSAEDAWEWQPYLRNKTRQETLAPRFKDPIGSLHMVLARAMWLIGCDFLCLQSRI